MAEGLKIIDESIKKRYIPLLINLNDFEEEEDQLNEI